MIFISLTFNDKSRKQESLPSSPTLTNEEDLKALNDYWKFTNILQDRWDKKKSVLKLSYTVIHRCLTKTKSSDFDNENFIHTVRLSREQSLPALKKVRRKPLTKAQR